MRSGSTAEIVASAGRRAYRSARSRRQRVRLPAQQALTIRILVGGTLNSPALSLDSDAQPPMTQSDLISYLAFGRTSSSLLTSFVALESDGRVTHGLLDGVRHPAELLAEAEAEVAAQRSTLSEQRTNLLLEKEQMQNEEAEAEAIKIFGRNLRELLLAAPAGPKAVLGLDPGIRTGCKVAVVDATGKLLETATLYPHQPRNDWQGSLATLARMVVQHNVELISIGNGTASRESDKLAGEVVKLVAAKMPDRKLSKIMVSEAGASVYSASALAAAEFPELDVSLRGAVSIARRLQDPLAELVKIDPKSIGVGQYQHDITATKLERSLDAVVEDCVNAVGVDVNTASPSLLARVAGVGPLLSENIVSFRNENGPFAKRSDLKKVPRLGAKAFEQCAGFLRITGGAEPLDSSSVHPEAYGVARKILSAAGAAAADVPRGVGSLATLDAQTFVDDSFGLPTVQDIIAELETSSFSERQSRLIDKEPSASMEMKKQAGYF